MPRELMDGDVSKLPRWAQRKIENLERDIESYRRLAHETAHNHEDSNVRLPRFGPRISDDDMDWGLPPDSQIDFYLPSDSKWGDKHINVRHVRSMPGRLVVCSNWGALKMLPSASNAIYLEIEDHR